MADYYPVIARAVSRLPENNAQARQTLYDRARAIVIEELRKRDPTKIAPEQAALEAAFLRIEAESAAKEAPAETTPPVRTAPAAQTTPPPRAPASRAAVEAVAPAKNAPNYLTRILRVVRPGKPRAKSRKTPPPAPAQSQPIAANDKRTPATGEELGGVLNSLSTMLYGTAFLVAIMAVTGVVYIRGVIWVDEGVITYPVLLVVTAIVFCLLIILPRAMFHSASTWSTFSFLSRVLYSASRRVF
jgi:hypothetical protein